MQITAADILEQRRQRWKSREILRRLYSKWYSQIGQWIRPGFILELGGGSGNLKEHFPEAISSDIVFAPWLDAALDAQKLPFKDGVVDSIVLFDVLHHLSAPSLFFHEAERVLKTGGRVVMMEPYVSFSSFFIYKFLHQEGLDRNGNPLRPQRAEGGRDPFRGNQAMPTLIFERHREDFLKRFSGLKILKEERTDFFIYPMSGGFHHRTLFPHSLYNAFERIESLLLPLSSWLAFRIFLVLEKI